MNLLLGTMSCDDDSPDSSLCYVTKITDVYLPDPSLVGFTKLTYDNLDRITFAEFKQPGYPCSPTLAEVIWEGDTVRKVIHIQPSSDACDISTTELTISYANNLVVKFENDLYPDLYEFSYNNDLTLSQIIYAGLVHSFQYNSDGNVQSMTTKYYTIKYFYDKNPNYLSPVVKALGNQPALVYFLFSGVTALSVNNVITEKDNHSDWTFSYVFNDKNIVVEQFATYDPDCCRSQQVYKEVLNMGFVNKPRHERDVTKCRFTASTSTVLR